MVLFWISCFAAGASLFFALWWVVSIGRQRVSRLQIPPLQADPAAPFPVEDTTVQRAFADPVWRKIRPWLRMAGHLLMPLLSWHLRAVLTRRFQSAGMEAEWDITAVAGLLLFAGVGGLGAGGLLAMGLSMEPTASGVVYGALAGLMTALVLVWRRMGECATRRKLAMLREFPFLLDLMTLCVEAGLNLHGALRQAAHHGPSGPLRHELRLALNAIRAGHARHQALIDMAVRCDVPALTLWVAAVHQAERLGMRLAPLLRTQADQQRSARFLRAETLAMQAPVRLLFPLVTCMFPCAFLVIGFPIGTLLLQSLQ